MSSAPLAAAVVRVTFASRWAALLATIFGGHYAARAAAEGPFSVRLRRQQIPLHSAGGVVHHKSAYYGQIAVGGPQAQVFEVVFDTGSGHLVLPSAMCRAETCRRHRRYRRKASGTAQDIDVDGTPVGPGQARDQITVSFGTGEVTGVFVRDRVCVGPAPALEATPEAVRAPSLLQVDQQRLHEAKGPPPSEEVPASGIDGLGGELVPGGGEATLAPHGCIDLRLVVATDMTEDPFSSFTFDGVLGLGLASLSQTAEFNFLEAAAASRAWGSPAAQPGLERMFAVFLAVTEEEESEITFGGWRPERLRPMAEDEGTARSTGDGPAWCHVQDPQDGYWQLDVFGITANGRKLDFCGPGEGKRCRAVVDTGTSLLGVPSALGPDLVDLLRHLSGSPDGACNGPGPRLEIDLGNFTIVLDPADYARPEVVDEAPLEPFHTNQTAEALGQIPLELAGGGVGAGAGGSTTSAGTEGRPQGSSCVPMLMHIDLPMPLDPRTLILGEPVLQRYYAVFDAGTSPRVGFGVARHAAAPTRQIVGSRLPSAAPQPLTASDSGISVV